MVDFNISDVLRRINNQNINTRLDIQKPAIAKDGQGGNNTQSLVQQLQSNLIKNMQQQILLPQNVRMNNLASADRSVYIKNLLKLPNNMSDLLIAYGNEKNSANLVKDNLNQNLQQLQNLAQNQNRLNQLQQMLPQQPQVQNQPQQQQIINTQPQVQPPVVPPNDKNTNSEQKVQQDNQQGRNNQHGNQEQPEAPKQPKLPQNPAESFAKTMQGVNNNINRPLPQPQVQQPVQQQAPVQTQPQVQQPVQQQAPVQTQPQVQQPVQQQAPVQTQPQVQQPVQQQAPVQTQPQVQQPVQQQAPVQTQPQVQQQVPQQAPVQTQPQVQQQVPQQAPIQTQPQVQQPVQQPQPNLNRPLPQQNNPNTIIQNPVPNQINRPAQNIARTNVPTGGAAMIQDEPAPEPMQKPQYAPQTQQITSASIYNRMHAQLLNQARFEPMMHLRESVRNHIRQPINMPPRAPVEQVQEEVSQELRQIQQQEAAQLAMKEVSAKIMPSRVNLSLINSQIQQHSKQALNSLILEMSTATRQGITDTKPLQDTIGLINASISASSQDDTATAIKNLMLLYLPWLPLEEGVGFKLDVETKNKSSSDNDDTSISIMVTTKNYGNISAEINLLTTNSVDIFITCDKTFPKEELLKRLKNDSNDHSMTATIGVEEVSQKETLTPDIQKAKVNLSNVTTINPYLLLMSHSFIRHSIELDINTTMYGNPVKA